jgi:hypothetical protein
MSDRDSVGSYKDSVDVLRQKKQRLLQLGYSKE